ncbi:MAG: prenyltransferase, partial [Coriobacteriales bacterium]|nr:prenyltransferase [Coriobacteriales bacterium]
MNTNYKPFTPKAAVELASPPSLVAAVMPVFVGGATAFGFMRFTPFVFDVRATAALLLMFVTAVLMQAAVNTLNDYQDFLSGTDTAETILDTHDASIVYNQINPRSALRFGIVLLVCAALSGCVLVLLSHWALLIVGVAAAAVVVLYSAGPKPVSFLPIGEFVSGLVMGVCITASTYYALTLRF